MKAQTTAILVSLIAVLIVLAAVVLRDLPNPQTQSSSPPPPQPPGPSTPCKESGGSGFALCVRANVTRVIDGDTIVIGFDSDRDGADDHVRLVLVDAPELNQTGGPEGKAYLESLCLGIRAVIDEDDFQVGADPYGRILAVVYCGETNANAAMISSGHAVTYYLFCSASEFGSEAWTGCSSSPPPGNCDPAYPDVCIPPPPPDLDCADIPYRNFRVLPPDPHHFDGDGDGIGCET